MDNQKALKNLIDATEVLEKCGLTYFLVDGTLLGAVREGSFIGHDTDIDVGVFMNEWTIDKMAEVLKEMMTKGFILYHSFGEFGRHFEVAWRRDGIKVDFFFYYQVGDKMRFNAFLNGGRTLPDDILTYEYPSSYFIKEKLIFIWIDGEVFICPDDPHEICRLKYGDDYMTPKTKWDWATSPKNLIAQGKDI